MLAAASGDEEADGISGFNSAIDFRVNRAQRHSVATNANAVNATTNHRAASFAKKEPAKELLPSLAIAFCERAPRRA